jgi:hypothetical protein
MLQNFYKEYITEIAQDTSSGFPDREAAIKEKYCTRRLIDSISSLDDDLDYDPLIYAQDANMEMLQSLIILKDQKKSHAFIASWKGDYNEVGTIHLMVARVNGNYKIDAVW